jgi:hypothetical protein
MSVETNQATWRAMKALRTHYERPTANPVPRHLMPSPGGACTGGLPIAGCQEHYGMKVET